MLRRSVCTVIVCCICILFLQCSDSMAAVKVMNWDLVDSGKHLDWDGKTKYSIHFKKAVNKWNNYKKGVIRKDNVYRWQDVGVTDYYEISNTAGVTYANGFIIFNRYIMDKLTYNQKTNVCIHELGHALGLDHNSSKDIMYPYVTSKTNLSSNDKASFNYAYKYKY